MVHGQFGPWRIWTLANSDLIRTQLHLVITGELSLTRKWLAESQAVCYDHILLHVPASVNEWNGN